MALDVYFNAGDVSRLRSLATLRPELPAIIDSPPDLAIHDADKLRPAPNDRRADVLQRALEIIKTEGALPAKHAVRRLSNFSKAEVDPIADEVRSIDVSGGSKLNRRGQPHRIVPRDYDGIPRGLHVSPPPGRCAWWPTAVVRCDLAVKIRAA